jgi:CDP-diacylglycerol--glycerol-3-phosphate 3-phosphatidyltransferase
MNIKDLLKISNLLSIFRLLLAIPFWILIDNFDQQSVRNFTAGLALFAAFTDVLDGYFARKLNQVTELGKIVDPIADKVVIGAIIIKMFMIGELPLYYFILIVGRDLLILMGGIIVAKKIGWVIPSNIIGKITVIIISLVILFTILGLDKGGYLYLILFYSSILLVILSLVSYLLNALKQLKKVRSESI